MFTIEQAGSIKKVNTIDELIGKCNSNGGNLNEEQLKSYINDLLEQNLHFVNDLLKGVATEEYANQVVKSIDLSEYTKLTTLDNYYTKDDADEQFVNKDELANELQNCALKSDIPTDCVSNDTLATTLSEYVKNDTLSN